MLSVYYTGLDPTAAHGGTILTDPENGSAIVAAIAAKTLFSTCSFYTAAAPVILTGVTFNSVYVEGAEQALPAYSINLQLLPYGLVANSGPGAVAAASLSYSEVVISPGPLYSNIPAIASMNCGLAGSVPVYSYSGSDTTGLSLGIDLGALYTLEAAHQANRVFPTCTLSGGFSTTLTNVTINDLSVQGFGPGVVTTEPLLYAQVDVGFNALSVSGSPVYSSPAGTLTCGTSVSFPLYSFSVNEGATGDHNVGEGDGAGEVESGVSAYAALASADIMGTVFPSCTATLGSTSITIGDVVFFSSALLGDGGFNAIYNTVYSSAYMSFDSLTAGGVTVHFSSDPNAKRAREKRQTRAVWAPRL